MPIRMKEVPYTTVYVTPTWRSFPSSIARQPRCQDRTARLRKDLGEMLPTPTFLARHHSKCGDIDSGKSAQWGGDMHRRIRYTMSLDPLIIEHTVSGTNALDVVKS